MAESNEVLLEAQLALVDGVVDYSGQPAVRSKTGYWRSAWFIIGVEVAERISYLGIKGNLISYLIGPLKQSTATAAKNVNIWAGTAYLLPLLGAFIADSFLGRYHTIILASLIYILGLGLLTLSAMLPSLTLCSPQSQVILFFISLYLVAIGQGGHKPCVQAFGADQFDEKHPKEHRARSSFFNWWYFTMIAGAMATLSILTYIQDNYSWVLGFGIPCVLMIIALIVFLLGTRTYRFNIKDNDKSPFLRIGRVFTTAVRNWRNTLSTTDIEEDGLLRRQKSEQFNFLNMALLTPKGSKEDETCSLSDVEEAKAVLRLVPIWATTLVYGIVFAQVFTFFIKQGSSMQRTIFPGFDIPPASLQTITNIAIVIFSAIYDRIFVPLARAITGKPTGITLLQRIGTGIFISIFTVVFAAFVEMKRLKIAQEYGLVDDPNATVPMSIWWLIPQYVLFGVSEVFTMVGLQEFFYDQVPNELRSMGLALYLSIVGVGSFLSGFLISLIEHFSGKDGHETWFCDNINKAHLDYFYWLLAGLSVMGFTLFIYFAKSYIYNHKGDSHRGSSLGFAANITEKELDMVFGALLEFGTMGNNSSPTEKQDDLDDQSLELHNAFDVLDVENERDDGEALLEVVDNLDVLSGMQVVDRNTSKSVLDEGTFSMSPINLEVFAYEKVRPSEIVGSKSDKHLKLNDGRLSF